MRWWEIGGLVLAVVGVLSTIYYGIKGPASSRSKSKDQRQRVGKSGIGIQSGRDTKLK